MDWTTVFPYILIATVLLFGIGIYALITSKKFLRVVFSVEILLMATNTLLLSFGFGFTGEELNPDPLAQVFGIFIIVIGLVFLLVGLSLERILRQSGDSTLLEFSLKVDGLEHPIKSESTETIDQQQGVNES